MGMEHEEQRIEEEKKKRKRKRNSKSGRCKESSNQIKNKGIFNSLDFVHFAIYTLLLKSLQSPSLKITCWSKWNRWFFFYKHCNPSTIACNPSNWWFFLRRNLVLDWRNFVWKHRLCSWWCASRRWSSFLRIISTPLCF